MGQLAITEDKISMGIDIIVLIMVEDAEKQITQIINYRNAVSKIG